MRATSYAGKSSTRSPSPYPSPRGARVHIPAIADKAIAVIGMRRAGKTTLLWQMIAAARERGFRYGGASAARAGFASSARHLSFGCRAP
jgi:hypothetical protein